jgi:hypothetical protein
MATSAFSGMVTRTIMAYREEIISQPVALAIIELAVMSELNTTGPLKTSLTEQEAQTMQEASRAMIDIEKSLMFGLRK